ncbi:MAG: methyltransferase [Pseudomonadota bacterium]|nr:methyltransferase [Pseudomonadota bacterium]
MSDFYAPCPKGLEGPLAEELQALGVADARASEAGVAFRGTMRTAMLVNLQSRIASRVLLRVASGQYQREDDVYAAAHAVRWEEWFSADLSLKVETSAIRCPLKSIDFLTLRVKDAICDRFRERSGRRPSIDVRNPDVQVNLHLDRNELTLYVDTSGPALFRRGERRDTGAAPLKKNLAAGILHLTGWKPGTPLFDPMCGSGTFLTEAAQISLRQAPGLGRRFAFERLEGFDRKAWQDLLAGVQQLELPPAPLPIWGADIDARAVEMSRDNLEWLGLADCVHVSQGDVLASTAPAPHGVLVTNPPYGMRVGEDEEMAAFYPAFGTLLKQQFAGWNVYILSGDLRLPKLIRLSTSRRTPLFNGQIECRLFEYRMVSGSNRPPEPLRA